MLALSQFSPSSVIFKNVDLVRDENLLLKSVDLMFVGGQHYVIWGPNGIGKTTLLRAISGLLEPEIGQIEFLNMQSHNSVCFLSNNDQFKPHLNVRQHLEMWQFIFDASSACVQSACEYWGVLSLLDMWPHQLSVGQKKRLRLCLLFLVQRPIWCLDEPSNGLDKNAIGLLNKLIEKQCECEGIVITTSHNLEDFHTKQIISLEKYAENARIRQFNLPIG